MKSPLMPVGVVLILAAVGLWVYALWWEVMVGGEVRSAMRSTGQPPRLWSPQWSEWRKDSADLAAGPLVPKRFASATISEYRIGHAEPSFFTTINLYEAKYVFSNGQSEVWAAQGPKRSVETNSLRLYGPMAVLILGGAGCIFVSRRSKPHRNATADGQIPQNGSEK